MDRRSYKFSLSLVVFLLAGLLLGPLPAGGTDLLQGFILPGGQSPGGNYGLTGVAGLPGAGSGLASIQIKEPFPLLGLFDKN